MNSAKLLVSSWPFSVTLIDGEVELQINLFFFPARKKSGEIVNQTKKKKNNPPAFNSLFLLYFAIYDRTNFSSLSGGDRL